MENAYNEIETYKNLPLKKSFDGSITKLSDVARVEFGPVTTRTLFKGNGKQVVGIGIYQQSDANTIKVASRLKKKIKEVQPTLPDGTSLEVSFDRSNYISRAIYEVYKTLIIALVLKVFHKTFFINSSTNLSIEILSCLWVSLLRSVTVSSSNDLWSTVIPYGVPASSCL